MKKRNLVVANWKMNPASTKEAKEIFKKIRKYAKKLKSTDVVVAPSYIHIPLLYKLLPSKNTFLGAQNVHDKELGAHTGEISIPSLKEFKVKYSIIGHSERRAMGESDDIIKSKILSALRLGITPIICVGEIERDNDGGYFEKIKSQLVSAFSEMQKKDINNCVIAYEPVWAIGHTYKDSLSGNDMHEMSLFIRKTMSDLFGKDYGWNIKILYGGSVEEANAEDIMKKGDINGFLVGHASLTEGFEKILKIADSVK